VSLGESVRKIRIFQPENYISLDYQKKEMAIFSLDQGQAKEPMSRIKVREIKMNQEDALRCELQAFLESVRNRTKPLVSGEDGRRALEAAILVNQEIAQRLQKFFNV